MAIYFGSLADIFKKLSELACCWSLSFKRVGYLKSRGQILISTRGAFIALTAMVLVAAILLGLKILIFQLHLLMLQVFCANRPLLRYSLEFHAPQSCQSAAL